MDPQNIDPQFFASLNGVGLAAYEALGLDDKGEPSATEPDVGYAWSLLDLIGKMSAGRPTR